MLVKGGMGGVGGERGKRGGLRGGGGISSLLSQVGSPGRSLGSRPAQPGLVPRPRPGAPTCKRKCEW